MLGGPVDLLLGDRRLHHRDDVRLLVGQVHRERRVDAVERGEHGRGILRRGARAPRRQRGVQCAQVDEHHGVLLLHALDVHRARRRPLLERVPQPLVFALVVRVQPQRGGRQLHGHGLRVSGVARGHAADERRPLAEAAAEHAVDVDHPARVAGLRCRSVAARRQWCGRHPSPPPSVLVETIDPRRGRGRPASASAVRSRARSGAGELPSVDAPDHPGSPVGRPSCPHACRDGCAGSTARRRGASTRRGRGTCTTARTRG